MLHSAAVQFLHRRRWDTEGVCLCVCVAACMPMGIIILFLLRFMNLIIISFILLHYLSVFIGKRAI